MLDLPVLQTESGPARYNVSNSMMLSPSNSSFQREIVASPTYRTSTHNILSSQLHNKYLNPSPLNKIISPKANQSQANDSIFYQPPLKNDFVPTKPLPSNGQPTDSNSVGPRKNLTAIVGANTSFHNPITNPMPYNIQNPYILREMVGVRPRNERSNYLANVASSNLLSFQA